MSAGAGAIIPGDWEMVIGLEVHCELQTATKLFCGCKNAFGDEPNTNVCPVCLGLPGSLPVLNERAVELAMRIGAALHCDVVPSSFARKNYFYPDMPKDYQISQYDEPINVGGWLELPDGTRVGVTRAHLEEDTGKTTHLGEGGRIHSAEHSLVDYNRSGVPLVETVSEPDMRTRGAGPSLRGRAAGHPGRHRRLGRPDGGGLHAGRRQRLGPGPGSAGFGTRCEIKNLNSLRSLARAIEFEAARQVALLEGGDVVRPRDPALGRGRRADTYHALEGRGLRLPLLPRARPGPGGPRRRPAGQGEGVDSAPCRPTAGGPCASSWARTPTEAQLDQVHAVVDQGLDPLVVAAAERGVPAPLALARAANEVAADVEAGRALDRGAFVALLVMEDGGELSATQAKAVLAELLAAGGGDPAAIAAAKGFEALDAGSLAAVVDEVAAANPLEWDRFVSGTDDERRSWSGSSPAR